MKETKSCIVQDCGKGGRRIRDMCINHYNNWRNNKLGPTHHSWRSMKDRCHGNSPKNKKLYSDRGISYDPRWKDYSIFLSDMGERPEGTTLDRIDSNKDYYKENCRWVTWDIQGANRRGVNPAYIGAKVSDRIKQLGLKRNTVYARVARGETIEEALR